ncbi:zinc ribbon domain-containing protein [Companilactobacillus huachuanensis]|uniref:Zinc ribbon domain-containing protein n=1 Tax=Companilactobacillus huachuanensis TaxID=2559914 RepID=A0ABW1RN99_9LACO|nr:zinc ribbon domain-containing protein [Companilactobacillus huachuanensis]
MSKIQTNLNSIYSYKEGLGYPSRSNMIVLVHVRGKHELSSLGRIFGDAMTKGRTGYFICFESGGLLFMQVNRKGMFTDNNSFMPRGKFSQIEIEKRNWIGGHYSSKQYNMELFDSQSETVEFTIYEKRSGIEWLEKYLQITIDNLSYYMRETNVLPLMDDTVKKKGNSEELIRNEKQQSKESDNFDSRFKFCAHCGNKLDIDDEYCKKCGVKSGI